MASRRKRKIQKTRKIRTNLLNISSPLLRQGKKKFYLDKKKNRLRDTDNPFTSIGLERMIKSVFQHNAAIFKK